MYRHVNMCIDAHTHIYVYKYIYIHTVREKERDREKYKLSYAILDDNVTPKTHRLS